MRGVKKQHLPSKICPVCERAFVWRKKWERCWDTVRYCSDRCRNQRNGTERAATECVADDS